MVSEAAGWSGCFSTGVENRRSCARMPAPPPMRRVALAKAPDLSISWFLSSPLLLKNENWWPQTWVVASPGLAQPGKVGQRWLCSRVSGAARTGAVPGIKSLVDLDGGPDPVAQAVNA